MKILIILAAVFVFISYNKGWFTGKNKAFKAPVFVNKLASQVKDSAGRVLGETTSNVSNFVLDNTIVNIVKQIDKLPQSQQAKIKEQICR